MSDLLTRRKFLVSCAAASLLTGCDRVHPVGGFLQEMKIWNEKFEELFFSPKRLAPEPPSVGNDSRRRLPGLFRLQFNAGCTSELEP